MSAASRRRGRAAVSAPVTQGSSKWLYVRRFATTGEVVEHLRAHGYESLGTSPPGKHATEYLQDFRPTQARLAVWFGNEAAGLSAEAREACGAGVVALETSGIVESMNLAVACAVVMYTIAQSRRRDSKAPGRAITGVPRAV